MRHGPKRRASRWNAFLRSLLVATLLSSAVHARSVTAATSSDEEARWRGEAVFQLAARADYAGTQGQVSRREAVVGSAQLRFASPARPISAGLMIEHRFVAEQADTLLVAGVLTYKMPTWTATASPFYKRTEHRGAGEWDYWASVRRHVASRHGLGIELFGSLGTGRAEQWTLGYYGTMTETLSVSVLAGAGFDSGPDWMARATVTWKLRPRGR
jgi:hypothetical protein